MDSLEKESTGVYIALGNIENGEKQTSENEEETRSILKGIQNACSWGLLLIEVFTIVFVLTVAINEHRFIKQILQSGLPIIIAPIQFPVEKFGPEVMDKLKRFTIPTTIDEKIAYPDDIYDIYYADETISDKMQQLCGIIFPIDWPDEWKNDPQFWSSKMREDLDFCNSIFS